MQTKSVSVLAAIVFLAALTSCTPVGDEPGDSVKLDVAWKVPIAFAPERQPVLEGDRFYVNRTLGPAAIDLSKGQLLWDVDMNIDFYGQGGVYSWGDYLVCLGSSRADATMTHGNRLAYWRKDGTYLGFETLPYYYRVSLTATGDGNLYVLKSYAGHGYDFYLLNPEGIPPEGRPATFWKSPELTMPPEAKPGESNGWLPGGPPFFDETSVYIAVQPGNNDYDPDPPPDELNEWTRKIPSQIVALDRSTLQVRWTIENKYLWPTGGNVRLAFQKVGENILYADAGGYVLFRPSDGEVLWQTLDQGSSFKSIGGATHWVERERIYETTRYDSYTPHAWPGREFFSVGSISFRPDLYPDKRSEVLWGVLIPKWESLQGNPVVHNGVVYVLSAKASLVIDAENGKLYGRDPGLVTDEMNTDQTTWKYNDLWLVRTADKCLTAVKMNLRVGLDGKLYK